MARPPLDNAKPFDYRVGSVDGFSLGGMMKDTDPGSSPPNRPRNVLNGRYQGGGIISRPPYEFVDWIPDFTQKTGDPYGPEPSTSTNQWNIKFMTEHHPTRFNNQLWVGRVDGNSSILQVVTQPFKLPEDVASYPSLITKPPVVERYNNEVFVGDTGYLRRIYRIGGTLADLPTDDILYSFDGFRVYAMAEFAGRLFVFVADPTGVANSYVFSYDGLTVYAEVTLTTAGKDGASFAEHNGRLFLGTKGDSLLRIRDAAGSWTTQAQTGGLGTYTHSGYGNAMWTINDALYIAGDANLSVYGEVGGTPTLVSDTAPHPGGMTRVLVGCSIGAYGFMGGTIVRPGETYYTPGFVNQNTGVINPDHLADESADTDMIPKGCTIFANRLYFAIGFDDISYGGSQIGFFAVPRSCLTPYGTHPSGWGPANSSIEYLKGDN
jgi:hypothetical protein